jgi:predicted amidohydrolase
MLARVLAETAGPFLLVLPAGFLDAGDRKPSGVCRQAATAVSRALVDAPEGSVVCLGVDGRGDCDQLGMAIGRGGVVAMARKFHPIGDERECLERAESAWALEGDKPRVFSFGALEFYIAVCYDSFGIRKERVRRLADVVVNLVHGFSRPGKPGSGSFYYARDGMLGAARTWGCPAVAAALFDGGIHRNWPTAVIWDGPRDPSRWRYADNPLRSAGILECRHGGETALLDVYPLSHLRARGSGTPGHLKTIASGRNE